MCVDILRIWVDLIRVHSLDITIRRYVSQGKIYQGRVSPPLSRIPLNERMTEQCEVERRHLGVDVHPDDPRWNHNPDDPTWRYEHKVARAIKIDNSIDQVRLCKDLTNFTRTDGSGWTVAVRTFITPENATGIEDPKTNFTVWNLGGDAEANWTPTQVFEQLDATAVFLKSQKMQNECAQ